MAVKYEIGQKVRLTPVSGQELSARDSALEPYAGQIGEVVNYHWISRGEQVFYIYTVRIGDPHKEVVVHEDELTTA